jgi:hypothetical protein
MDKSVRAYLVERKVGSRVIEGGLDYLLDRWERTTKAVEGGVETWMLEEWVNDLDTREIIHGLRENVPSALAAIEQRVGSIDARFRVASVEVDECTWGHANADRHGWSSAVNWWYWRTPKTPYE